MKKYLFYLERPAHYHLFKHLIKYLIRQKDVVEVLIFRNPILKELIDADGIAYSVLWSNPSVIAPSGSLAETLLLDATLLTYVLARRPHVMVSTSFCVAHVGKITGVRSVLFTEDDIKVLPLFSKWSYPFCSRIISPDCCDNGKWRSKTVSHPSYHELAYLHPDQFKPKESVASKYVNVSEPYVILRFSKLNKRFEKGVNGITVAIAKRIIQTIEPLARIYISSDVDLDPELVPYNLKLKPGEMHHVMAFARLFVGDSHTMAAESAVLGVPFVRINEFVDRLSYLRELEARYGLGIGFLPKNAINALPYIHRVLSDINTRAEWAVKRERMLSEKMNLLHFMIELVETYRTKGRFSFKGTFNKFFR